MTQEKVQFPEGGPVIGANVNILYFYSLLLFTLIFGVALCEEIVPRTGSER
jgi:hypothetical protein